MWTADNRARYDHKTDRYPSDMTDEEWQLVEPLLPPLGKNQEDRRRELLNAILYMLHTGCQWRQLPKDFPPRSTTHDYLMLLQSYGYLAKIHLTLYTACREQTEKKTSPTLGIADSQSVKSAEKGGQHIDSSGYDGGKKVKGKKRHIIVDTLGLMIALIVTPANFQDRDVIGTLTKMACAIHPSLTKALVDGAYQGERTAEDVRREADIALEVVKRSDAAKGFEVLPKRWIVERTFGWLGRCRRIVRDLENLTRSHAAFIMLAMIRLMMRRIVKG